MSRRMSIAVGPHGHVLDERHLHNANKPVRHQANGFVREASCSTLGFLVATEEFSDRLVHLQLIFLLREPMSLVI